MVLHTCHSWNQFDICLHLCSHCICSILCWCLHVNTCCLYHPCFTILTRTCQCYTTLLLCHLEKSSTTLNWFIWFVVFLKFLNPIAFIHVCPLYCARPFHTCTCWNFCHATLFIVNVLCCSAIFAWICFVHLCCALSRAGPCGYSSVAIWLAWQCTRVHVCTCSHQTSCPCPCIEIYMLSALWYLQCITVNITSCLDTDWWFYNSDQVMKNDEKHTRNLRQMKF